MCLELSLPRVGVTLRAPPLRGQAPAPPPLEGRAPFTGRHTPASLP